MDTIFCLREVQEKCIELNMPLYIVFTDFTKAFDIVSRLGLWSVLKKYGFPETVLLLLGSDAGSGLQRHHGKSEDTSKLGRKPSCSMCYNRPFYSCGLSNLAFE